MSLPSDIRVFDPETYTKHVKDMLYLLDDGQADIDTNLAIVSAWISGNVTSKFAEKAVRKVLEDYRSKLSVFLVAVAQRKIRSIYRMLEVLDRMEDDLYKSSRWANNEDIDKLLKAVQYLNNAITNSLEFIRKVLGGDQLDIKALLSASPITFNTLVLDLPPHSRDKIRQGLDRLIQKLNVAVGKNLLNEEEEKL